MLYSLYNPYMHPYMIQQPFSPPFRPGIPPFMPGIPPFGPGGPGGPVGPGGPPTSPPPSYIPETAPYRVDPGSIRRCRRKYTYIWLVDGQSFWYYPTYIGRTSISGYRWIGYMWIYYGTDLRRIRSFTCY